MDTITKIIGDYHTFLDTVFTNLEDTQIDVSDFYIDHIAYRTLTEEDYILRKDQLSPYGEMISEKIIRDRPVAIFKLNTPLSYNHSTIPYFELLAPADGDAYQEGLEHAEFVVDIPLSQIARKYPSILSVLKDRKINAELVLKFPNNANVKFHELPIDEVIEIEK